MGGGCSTATSGICTWGWQGAGATRCTHIQGTGAMGTLEVNTLRRGRRRTFSQSHAKSGGWRLNCTMGARPKKPPKQSVRKSGATASVNGFCGKLADSGVRHGAEPHASMQPAARQDWVKSGEDIWVVATIQGSQVWGQAAAGFDAIVLVLALAPLGDSPLGAACRVAPRIVGGG